MDSYRSMYSSGGLFSENLTHFLYAIHMIPAVSTLHSKTNVEGVVTLLTSQDQCLHSFSRELPPLDEECFNDMTKRMMQLSAQILLNDCYEKVKKLGMLDGSPIMEFYRHVRNACAHNGRFKIRTLKREALWHNLEITQKLDGTNLFEFMAIGDAYLFLQDVEAHLKGESSDWEYDGKSRV